MLALLAALLPGQAWGDTFHVSTEAELRQALEGINSTSGSHFIEIEADIALSDSLPPVLNNVSIRGNGHSIDAGGQHGIFVLGSAEAGTGPRILANIDDLELIGGLAQGGDGADGGGGGMGSGGAVQVNARADVVLRNVEVADSEASGGDGATGSGGGGGGRQGHGGSGNGGGGGGLQGDGGAGGNHGGGGGALAPGGDAGDGGGGGGGLAPGGDGSTPDGEAGGWTFPWLGDIAGAGEDGGSSGADGGGGGAGDNAGAGGGGGFGGAPGSGGFGGDGGTLGGGGGAGSGGSGGDGGFAGGGGGAIDGPGGAGGFAGGGGGSASGAGGAGGYGGGGGAGLTGGDGGYGGGGGAGDAPGSGGIGAGEGGQNGGGGGAGLGGAIFVAEGGGLTLTGSTGIAGNEVVAGLGAADGEMGERAGSGLFLEGSGVLTLRGTSSGTPLIIEDSIADAHGAGLSGARDFDRWHLNVTGTGIDGEVHLLGDNQYSGDTHVSGTTLVVAEDRNLGGSDGSVVLHEGGLGMADGFSLTRDVVIGAGGGRFAVNQGDRAALSGNVSGDGGAEIVGGGVLALDTVTGFDGDWNILDGALEIDSDALLGQSSLNLSGGGLILSRDLADLRQVNIGSEGGFIDNDGNQVVLDGGVQGSGDMVYRGTGSTRVESDLRSGDTFIQAGILIGDAGGNAVNIAAGATYDLGGQDRFLGEVVGNGDVLLGASDLLLSPAASQDPMDIAVFSGSFSGDGQVILQGNGAIAFLGNNEHSGGTRIESGVLAIQQDANLGDAGVELAGGTLAYLQGVESNAIIHLDGGGTIATGMGDVPIPGEVSLNDEITGTGDLRFSGGTFVLGAQNSYQGDTIVAGEDARLALDEDATVGDGNLILSNFGGLQIRHDTDELAPVVLQNGGGVIDVMDNQVTSSGGLTGATDDDGLILQGTGSLTLTGTVDYSGLTDLQGGTLRLAGSGTTAAVSGDISIGGDGALEIDRDGQVLLDNRISGSGSVRMNGSGLLELTGDHYNLFTGGLRINDGTVSFDGEHLLGVGPVVLDGGELLFGNDLATGLELDQDGGRLSVAADEQYTMFGDTFGAGDLGISGAGTLVFAGIAEHQGETRVKDGTLQIGTGKRGLLAGDIFVEQAGTLAFGRDDLVGYEGIIEGDGAVSMVGDGELVFTGDHVYQGVTRVESGTLRLGLGGDSGSVAGDVEISQGARLIFDRSGDPLHENDILGEGELVKRGSGVLTLLGEATHQGGTLIDSGIFQIGNGGQQGNLTGDVFIGGSGRLRFDRSDDFTLSANLDGAGGLEQAGSGTVLLEGANSMLGNVLVRDGGIAVDADQRLGQGELLLDGGALVYADAFNDLRSVRLGADGGALDTGGHDVRYGRTISGEGVLEKAGQGRLVLTGNIVADDVRITEGELRVGDNDHTGNLLGDVFIDDDGTLAFGRSDIISFTGNLEGTGGILQDGDGALFLGTDHGGFSGTTEVHRGILHLDAALGGDMLVSGGRLAGSGSLGGVLHVADGGTLALGNTGESLTVGGGVTFETGSRWEVSVEEDGDSDRINASGTAVLGGDVHVLPGGGEFSDDMSFRILEAASIDGTFDNVTSDLVFLSPQLIYGNDHVDLSLGRSDTAFTQVSFSDNQFAVAEALNELDSSHPAVSHVLAQDAAGARRAYDGFSGDSLLGGYMAGARGSKLFGDHMHQRNARLGHASRGRLSERLDSGLAALTEGAIATFPLAHQASGRRRGASPVRRLESVWLQGQHMRLEEQKDSGTGNPEFSVSGQMFSVGGDGYWGEHLILGAAAGHGRGDIRYDDRDASGELESWYGGLYGRWDARGNLHLTGSVSWGVTELDQTRRMPQDNSSARSSMEVTALTTSLEVGHASHAGEFSLRPYVGVTMQDLEREGFEESGTGTGLRVDAAGHRYGEMALGVDVSRPWLPGGRRWAQLQAGGALVRGFGDTRLEQESAFIGTEASFRTRGAPHDGLALDMSLGAELYLSPEVALWAGYRGRFGDQRQEHSALINASLTW